MKKSLFSPPDEFSLSPFLTLLPVIANIKTLPGFSTSFHARLENVEAILKGAEEKGDRQAVRRLAAEQQMLQMALDWIEINAGGEK